MKVSSGPHIWIISPGRALWVPAGTAHELYSVTAVQTRTVYLSGVSTSFPDHCEVWRVSPLMREIIIRFAEEPDTLMAEPLTVLLIGELDRLDAEPINFTQVRSAQLIKLQNALLANPADKRRLEDWGRDLGASPRTLMRRLQKETGSTFRQWRRQIRMLRAMEALAMSVPVTTVALDVGYENTSAFIEAFRQSTGTTPARYFD